MGALHLMGVVLVPGAQGQRAQRRCVGKLQVGKVPVQDAALQPGAPMRQVRVHTIHSTIACMGYTSNQGFAQGIKISVIHLQMHPSQSCLDLDLS